MDNIWTNINDKIPQYMGEIIKKYHLKSFKLSDIKTALVGKNYALIMFVDRFSVDISYLKKEENEYIIYQCNNFFAEKFDDTDRRNLVKKGDVESTIINNLIIISNGLINKWSDVLEGQCDWIKEYEMSQWYSKQKANDDEKRIFCKLFP